MIDPIVEEIRKYREEYAAKFNYDLSAICQDLREQEETCGLEVISRTSKKGKKNKPENACSVESD